MPPKRQATKRGADVETSAATGTGAKKRASRTTSKAATKTASSSAAKQSSRATSNDDESRRAHGDDLRARAQDYRESMNSRFVKQREADGEWRDEFRGAGLQQTLEALDALWTQAETLQRGIRYADKLILEDIEQIDSAVSDQPIDGAYPPYEYLRESASSPETAGLLLRVLAGTRVELKRRSAWSPELRARFETSTANACGFLSDSCDPSGGWGILHDTEPFLPATASIARSLAEFRRSELFAQHFDERFEEMLSLAREFTRRCMAGDEDSKGRYYSTKGRNVHVPVYSAYAIIGLYWIRPDPIARSPDFDVLVEPALAYARNTVRNHPKELDKAATEDPRTNSTTAYRDAAGGWPWIDAMSMWLDREPTLYSGPWIEDFESLLDLLLSSERPQAIYTWNRAAIALASYWHRAPRQLGITDYELRRAIYRLVADRPTAAAAYRRISSDLGGI